MLFEPIQDGGQMNEAQEIEVALFVTSADTAVAFGALKEILDAMPLPIKAAMPPHRSTPAGARRNAKTATKSRFRAWTAAPPLSKLPELRRGQALIRGISVGDLSDSPKLAG